MCEDKVEFPRLVFLMHQWYATSEEIATLFLNLYPFILLYIHTTPLHYYRYTTIAKFS